jgi:DNA-binding response OmpR family regulator
MKLERQGYQVICVDQGLPGLDLLGHTSVDAVILDLALPDTDGTDILREVRESGDETPVIVLTGRAEEADALIGYELGADVYMTKPFSLEQLTRAVHMVVCPPETARPRPLLLVIDQSIGVARAIRAARLTLELDVEVRHAPDSDEALTILASTRVDVLLVGKTSRAARPASLVRLLRDAGHAVPIVLLAYGWRREEVEAALTAGANTALRHPFYASSAASAISAFLADYKGDTQCEGNSRDEGPVTPRFLVAHSDDSVTRWIMWALGFDDYQVVLAQDGDKVTDAVYDWDYDVLLLSDDLPGTDGLDVTETLRAMGYGGAILLLTSGGSPYAGHADDLGGASPLRYRRP